MYDQVKQEKKERSLNSSPNNKSAGTSKLKNHNRDSLSMISD